MSTLKFAKVHNLVAFLSKPTESEGFEHNDNVKAKIVNGEVQLQALVDGKKVIINESTIRRDLQLEDAEDEAVNKEMDKSLVRAATTASCLEAEQDSSNINKTQSKATPNESRVNIPRSDEDSLKLKELMELCTNLQNKVKKLEKKQRSKTHKLKRLYKVGLTARVESSKDEGINLVDKTRENQGRFNDQEDAEMLFDVADDLIGEEVFVSQEVPLKEVNAASATTTTATFDDITLAKALMEIKSAKPKIDKVKVQDKGKGKMVKPEPVKKLSKNDQLLIDEEVAKMLQAEINKEERLAGERARQEQEANIALIKT
uniref:Uncharacterized protein n=1 Tax=Tanacetum cinerariifolium TaxID=118510 RepID=A0A6L2MQC8_TANCI|nr:hypothetical protein [Tanacetum cinerariifolium]